MEGEKYTFIFRDDELKIIVMKDIQYEQGWKLAYLKGWQVYNYITVVETPRPWKFWFKPSLDYPDGLRRDFETKADGLDFAYQNELDIADIFYEHQRKEFSHREHYSDEAWIEHVEDIILYVNNRRAWSEKHTPAHRRYRREYDD